MATPRQRLAEISAAVWKGFAAGAIARTRPSACRADRRPEGHPSGPSAAPQARRLASAVISQHGAPKGLDGLGMASAGHRSTVHDGRGRGDRRHRGRDREERPVRALHRRHRRPGRGVRHDRPQRSAAGQDARLAARRGPARRPRSEPAERRHDRQPEVELWVRTRARVERQGGGCTFVPPTTNHILSSFARPAAAAWKTGTRGDRGCHGELEARPEMAIILRRRKEPQWVRRSYAAKLPHAFTPCPKT